MKRLSLVLLMVLARPALAHTPGKLLASSPYLVANPADSYALFGVFKTGHERFVVQLSHVERFAAPVEIFVPHVDALRAHRPAYAVVGPGLPAPDAAELAALPAPLPIGWGAVVESNQVSPRPVFFESIMRRFFWTSESLAIVFPQGPSEIWVWSPEHTTGKFGLGFGVEEGGGYLAALDDWSLYAY
ncbi:MAG: hypothetical protein NT062_13485 [Proteobacteria bacterium]|nr:hypothetical protein [Pseudomonadota bacterium]